MAVFMTNLFLAWWMDYERAVFGRRTARTVPLPPPPA
jgi:hypothetical protein